MIKAFDIERNEDILGNEAIKGKEYICPCCKESVSFVDAIFKVKHFRHKIERHCETEPETIEHIQMKQFFIDTLNLNKGQIEVNLGFARPDIYLEKDKIAIEVQNSPISYLDFMIRNEKYTENGIYVLWIFNLDLLNPNVSEFLKKAHELYFGRVYFFDKESILPIHFERRGRWIEPNDFSYGDGYWKWYKKLRYFKNGSLIINFKFLKVENTFKDNNFKICRFFDKQFWKNGK